MEVVRVGSLSATSPRHQQLWELTSFLFPWSTLEIWHRPGCFALLLLILSLQEGRAEEEVHH